MSEITIYDPQKAFRFDKDKSAYHVDIYLKNYASLFNPLDPSPEKQRDIDKNIAHYLDDCSHDIDLDYSIILNFFLPLKVHNTIKENKSIESIRFYYSYLIYTMKREIKRLERSAWWYSGIGMILLTLGYILERTIVTKILSDIVPAGLVIGGWVLFWEAFTLVLFERKQKRMKIKEYDRIVKAEVMFHYE